jgi:hypothetical protein
MCPVKVARFCLRPVCVVRSAATTLARDTSPIVLEGLKLKQVFGDAGVLLMRKAEATLDSVSLPSTLTPDAEDEPLFDSGCVRSGLDAGTTTSVTFTTLMASENRKLHQVSGDEGVLHARSAEPAPASVKAP